LASVLAVDAPCPKEVADLAEACISYVERAVGVKLDYEPETLPLLGHYLSNARDSLVVPAAAAYFGEVARRRHGGRWLLAAGGATPSDPAEWRVELLDAPISFTPAQIILLLLGTEDAAGLDLAVFELEPLDRQAAEDRLSELPPVSEDEYYSPSTWLEVLDILVDTARVRRLALN
jgi:hypothetical protein